jgi:hypothetical protein
MGAKLKLGAFALAPAAPARVQTGEMGWNPNATTDFLDGANTNTMALNTYIGSQLAGTTVSGALATRANREH